MKVKEESEKTGFKLNIQKTKIIVSGPITSLQIDGEKVETMTDFIFLCSKTTVDGDCSHEIKRQLFLGRKTMMNLLDNILNSRDITWLTKVLIVKAMVFPVVVYVYGDGSKVECWKEQYCIGTWNIRSMNQGKLEVIKQERSLLTINS